MVKVRPQQLTIDVPRQWGEPWVNVVVQRIEENGKIVNTVDRWDSFTVRLSDAGEHPFPLPASVNCEDRTYTVAAVGEAITTVALAWLAERYNGRMVPPGEVIIED